jgi:hypothetical protein
MKIGQEADRGKPKIDTLKVALKSKRGENWDSARFPVAARS